MVAAREVVPRPGRAPDGGHDAVVVVLLPDSGRSYLSKIYNDEWMRANGLLATTGRGRPGRRRCSRDRHHAGPLPDRRRRPDDRARRRRDRDAPGVRHQPAAGLRAARRRRRRRARRLDHREGPARSGVPRPVDRRADRRRGHGPAAAAGRRRRPASTRRSRCCQGGASALVAIRGGRPVGVVTKLDLLEYLAHRPDAAR